VKFNSSRNENEAPPAAAFGKRARAAALRGALMAAALGAGSGCTAVNYAKLPQARTPGELLITQEALTEPYESKGVLQLTRKGPILFGFADVAGTDLETAVAELGPQIRARGADGLVNVRVEQTQYTTFRRIVAILHFFAPLPSEVTINGELVKRLPAPATATEPAAAPKKTEGGT